MMVKGILRKKGDNFLSKSYSVVDFALKIISPKYEMADSLVLSVSVMMAMPEILGGSSPKAFW